VDVRVLEPTHLYVRLSPSTWIYGDSGKPELKNFQRSLRLLMDDPCHKLPFEALKDISAAYKVKRVLWVCHNPYEVAAKRDPRILVSARTRESIRVSYLEERCRS
jgi:hypothetical protein